MPDATARRSRPPRAERRRSATPEVAERRSFALPRGAAWWVLGALWLAATATFVVLTALAIVSKVTWYLAVDQYGYLAFAHDLLRGRVFHHWPPLDALGPVLPPQVDVLSQTYVWDHGRLYCRYAPGFPILLAGWLGLFGDGWAHYLNPTIFLALLLLVLLFAARLFHSAWRGLACALLVALFPTSMHLWALTLVRDLSTHLFGLLGLLLVLPVRGRRLGPLRVAAAGLAIGFAGSIRPENVIYAVPAALAASWRWWDERATPRRWLGGLVAGGLGVALGLAPFLVYNYLATGHPLRPTQGMEIQQFLSAPAPPAAGAPGIGYPPAAWRGGTGMAVQGGGLRLEHLPDTLPGNLLLLRLAYGDPLLALALSGVVVAAFQRRLLCLIAIPYSIVALLLYSCWSRPETRYLIGIYLFVPMLVVEGALGTLDLVRRLGRGGRTTRILAAAFAAACALAIGIGAAVASGKAGTLGVPSWMSHVLRVNAVLPVLTQIVPGVAAVAALAAALWPRRRVAAAAAPVLALALLAFAGSRALGSLETRARFQEPEVERARTAFARLVPPGAVVITTEDVGRPAENIDYYSGGAHALYLTDLERWRLPVWRAAIHLARGGFAPYLLIPPDQPKRAEMIAQLEEHFDVDLVAEIPAEEAIEYFVAAAFYPQGVEMELLRLVWHGPRWIERTLERLQR